MRQVNVYMVWLTVNMVSIRPPAMLLGSNLMFLIQLKCQVSPMNVCTLQGANHGQSVDVLLCFSCLHTTLKAYCLSSHRLKQVQL